MSSYLVTLEETVRYTIRVDAQDEEQAGELAESEFVKSFAPFDEFSSEVSERHVALIMAVSDPTKNKRREI